MAVAVTDTDSGHSQGSAVASITMANFTTSGDNRQLVVGCGVQSGSETITSVVRDGTETYTEEGNADQADIDTTLWSSDSEPATAAGDIVCTLSNSRKVACGALALSGVDQDTPFDAADTATDSNTSISTTPSSDSGDLVLDVAVIQGDATGIAVTEGGQSVEIENLGAGDASNRIDFYMSSRAGSAGTTTMGWDWTTSVPCTQVGIAANPAAGDVNVSLNAINIASLMPALGVTPGAASTNLNTLNIVTLMPALNVALDAAIIDLNTLNIAALTSSLGVTPGTTSISINPILMSTLINSLTVSNNPATGSGSPIISSNGIHGAIFGKRIIN